MFYLVGPEWLLLCWDNHNTRLRCISGLLILPPSPSFPPLFQSPLFSHVTAIHSIYIICLGKVLRHKMLNIFCNLSSSLPNLLNPTQFRIVLCPDFVKYLMKIGQSLWSEAKWGEENWKSQKYTLWKGNKRVQLKWQQTLFQVCILVLNVEHTSSPVSGPLGVFHFLNCWFLLFPVSVFFSR